MTGRVGASSLARALALGAIGLTIGGVARADAVDVLRGFVRDVKAGQAQFVQVVNAPDGKKAKTSSGSFQFQRPNRFRFEYLKPYPQTIVGDGQQVWLYDPDLNQVTVRPLGDALGATPAALLAGQGLDKEFELKALADEGELSWVQATPRRKDGSIQSLKIGFKGKVLAKLEIADSFGQRSVLSFNGFQADPSFTADAFRFTPPAGADVARP